MLSIANRQSLSAFMNLSLVRFLKLNRRVAKDAERVGHPADFVGAIATRHINRCVSRREAAHRTGNCLDWPHHLSDHIPRCDQNRPRQARGCDEEKQQLAVAGSPWPKLDSVASSLLLCAVATRSVTSLPSCKRRELLLSKDAIEQLRLFVALRVANRRGLPVEAPKPIRVSVRDF